MRLLSERPPAAGPRGQSLRGCS